jgi:hypothetical protein
VSQAWSAPKGSLLRSRSVHDARPAVAGLQSLALAIEGLPPKSVFLHKAQYVTKRVFLLTLSRVLGRQMPFSGWQTPTDVDDDYEDDEAEVRCDAEDGVCDRCRYRRLIDGFRIERCLGE